MAYTVTSRYTTVVGNKREVSIFVSADAVSGVVDSGLGKIENATLCPVSMGTWTNGVPGVKINELTAATGSNGKVHLVNITSGDTFSITCTGV